MQREVVGQLQRAIGFDRWCWPTSDPTTQLPGPGLAVHDYGPHLPRALAREYSGDDLGTKLDAAHGLTPAISLSRATGRDLARSARWDEVLRHAGIGDVVVLACRDRFGSWGWLELYRDGEQQPFSGEELRLLAQLAPSFGAVLRRWSTAPAPAQRNGTTGAGVTGSGVRGSGVTGAGVIVLDEDLRLIGQTDSAAAWIAALPAAAMFASWHILPPAVYAAAARARAGHLDGAHMIERSAAGEWVEIEAAQVRETHDIAVTIRAAPVARVADQVSRAYGLSVREREVVALVTAGHDTDGIARALTISTWTVQDHLKSVFDKLGIHSRREALTRLSGTVLSESGTVIPRP